MPTPFGGADSPEVVARIHEGMRMVTVIARQLQRQTGWRNIDDLRSAGNEGLVLAARAYDEAVGVPFRRYCTIRVRGAMIDAMRSQALLSRHALACVRAIEAADFVSEATAEEERLNPPTTPSGADEQLSAYLAGIATAMALGLLAQPVGGRDPELDTPDALDMGEGADDQIARRELATAVREAIEMQPDAERHLLRRHYFDGVSFVDAAKEIGLSKSWASRIHARAVESVARELRRRRMLAP